MGKASRTAEDLKLEINRFLGSCRNPALLEPGEATIELRNGCYSVEHRHGRLLVEAWDDERNLARRVVGLERASPGRMDLRIERFGKRRGTITLLDQARPVSVPATLQAGRRLFREQFRQFLRRQYPGWKLESLSTEPDLERTLSPVYPRASLRQANRVWAAIGAPEGAGAGHGALTYGLIWLDYLRHREAGRVVEGLALFLPAGHENATCLLWRRLSRRAARYAIFLYSPDGLERSIDPRDHGNLESQLKTWHSGASELPAEVGQSLAGIDGAQCVPSGDGEIGIRINGLEIGRWARDRLLLGVDRKRPVRRQVAQRLRQLAAGVMGLRAAASHPGNRIFARSPEAWLEAQVRRSILKLGANLLPSPVYGQVPAMTGGDRGVLDLLAVDRTGRLAVIELKATSDPGLPLQALEYWMRVRHHSDLGEFGDRGYFPGVSLSKELPRMVLVAPALEFHPTTETLLRYIDPTVPIERIGVGSQWRGEFKVVLRVLGASKPGI